MIKQFTIGVSRTFNLGNFESYRIENALTVEVAEGEDYAALEARAHIVLRDMLRNTYREHRHIND